MAMEGLNELPLLHPVRQIVHACAARAPVEVVLGPEEGQVLGAHFGYVFATLCVFLEGSTVVVQAVDVPCFRG